MSREIDWENLGFTYMPTNGYVSAVFRGGSWSPPSVRRDEDLKLHVAASCLHYGQSCFEGLKAFGRKDGTVAFFRPAENARRLAQSARRLEMEPPPEGLFLETISAAVKLSSDFVPPYGTGASLYIRPLLIGTTARIGLKPASEYELIVLAVPVGPYYKNGFFPVKAFVQEAFDRAAPRGVGNVKAAGNYAAGLTGDIDARRKGYPIALYLDSARHRFVDEFGTSNFFGISSAGSYVTPDSRSVLPSITNDSLQQIAGEMGLNVEKRPVEVSELSRFEEVGACGTAAVITPVCSITHGETVYRFGKEDRAGETLTRLYNRIREIQYGETDDFWGWMVSVEDAAARAA